MASNEYVSVSSQADTEQADLALERKGLEANETFEHEELAAIYVKRGLDLRLAKEVAEQLMAHDALAAHGRDELGNSLAARPLQAAVASAVSFVVRRCAFADRCRSSGGNTAVLRRRTVACFPPGLGRVGGASGWRERDRRCGTRSVLGSFGNGTDD